MRRELGAAGKLSDSDTGLTLVKERGKESRLDGSVLACSVVLRSFHMAGEESSS